MVDTSVKKFENIEGKGVKGVINNKLYYIGSTKLMDDLGINYDKKKIDKLAKQGKTPMILSDTSQILGIIAVADTIKSTSQESIANLREIGIETVMLTGDNSHTARYIANKVNIDEVIAEVLPSQKQDIIKKYKLQKKIVAMVGDGINDSPALAESDIGIAMGTGTDIAIESANITLLKGDLKKLVKAIKLSRRTVRTIRQNLFWAFFYNILGIPLASGLFYPFFGIMLSPVFAGFAMAISSVSVVGNSLRLKNLKL